MNRFIVRFQNIETSYDAIHQFHNEWKDLDHLSIVMRAQKDKNYPFLCNEMTKRAVLLKSAIFDSGIKFRQNSNVSQVKDADIHKICISDEQARLVISGFLKADNYKGYTVLVPVGSVAHEGCLFVKKNENPFRNKYDFVLYNPNKERMKSAERLMSHDKTVKRLSAVHSLLLSTQQHRRRVLGSHVLGDRFIYQPRA